MTTIDALTIELPTREKRNAVTQSRSGHFTRGVCEVEASSGNSSYTITISKKGTLDTLKIVTSDIDKFNELGRLFGYDRHGRLASDLHQFYCGQIDADSQQNRPVHQTKTAEEVLETSYIKDGLADREKSVHAKGVLDRLVEIFGINNIVRYDR